MAAKKKATEQSVDVPMEYRAEWNVYQRVHKVMQTLKTVLKEAKKVNNQYSYVSHDAVTAAVREHCKAAGLVVTSDVESYNMDQFDRLWVNLVVEVVNIDNPTDKITVKSLGCGIDKGDKASGKAISYAYKYALLKVFMLETLDDPDHDQTTRAKPYRKKQQAPNPMAGPVSGAPLQASTPNGAAPQPGANPFGNFNNSGGNPFTS